MKLINFTLRPPNRISRLGDQSRRDPTLEIVLDELLGVDEGDGQSHYAGFILQLYIRQWDQLAQLV